MFQSAFECTYDERKQQIGWDYYLNLSRKYLKPVASTGVSASRGSPTLAALARKIGAAWYCTVHHHAFPSFIHTLVCSVLNASYIHTTDCRTTNTRSQAIAIMALVYLPNISPSVPISLLRNSLKIKYQAFMPVGYENQRFRTCCHCRKSRIIS